MPSPLAGPSDAATRSSFERSSRFSLMCESTLALLNLREEELLQVFIRQPERGRFFHGLVGIPAIDDRAFHEPHPGGSSTARSMNERRLHPRRRDRLQECV